MRKMLLPIVIISLSLSGCFAVQMPSASMTPLAEQVVHVAPSTVVYGIRAALSGAAGTTILSDGLHTLVIWTYQGQNCAGFFAVNSAGQSVDASAILRAGGNLANSQTVSDLVTALKSNGWTAVAPGAAPAVLAELVGARVMSMPVVLLAVGVFPGGFETWMQDTFYPEEIEL